MGEYNKKHNRKIHRPCPVCGGRVIVAHRNDNWWVTCDADRKHIPQRFYPYAGQAVWLWNEHGIEGPPEIAIIVRCKDCVHWFDNGTGYSSCDRDALLRESNFFCAAGEKRK